jgi:hypothetical protein
MILLMRTVGAFLFILLSIFGSAEITRTCALAYAAQTDQKHVTVYVTNTGKRYHRAYCRYLRFSSRPIELRDATAAGYTPCHVCTPPVLEVRGASK